jgi:nucleoside-diphosphate-sugar epimerase
VKVLLLGGHGRLGPHVTKALEGHFDLRVTDVVPIETPHESMQIDVSDLDQVRRAAAGTDVIVNCAVQRGDRRAAFDVNTLGTYNAIRAAVELGHERFINTGPHFTLTGPQYYGYDFDIPESVPPHSGTNLYAMSKSAGQEICRLFTQHHPIHVLTLLYVSFRPPVPPRQGQGVNSFAVTYADGGRAVRCALEADTGALPSRNELFFITDDLPHGRYANAKARRLLGFEPRDSLEAYWRLPSVESGA